MTFEFSAKANQYASSADVGSWTIVSVPKELSAHIRNNYKCLEEGWGRMKVSAKIGRTQWQTSIWFDTKQETYLLPLKALIRKKERIVPGDEVKVTLYLDSFSL